MQPYIDGGEAMKTYRMKIGGHEVNLCAKTMNISRKRCMAYLNSLLKKTKSDNGTYRFFWADVIMLNMLTNRILYHADVAHIERAIRPVKGEKEDE